jgi:hypothetical protein
LFEDVHVVAKVRRQDGAELEEGGDHVLGVSAAGELLDEDATDGESGGFIGGKSDGLEVEAFEEGIADAALRGNGNTGFAERGEITIGGADGDVEFAGDVLGACDAAGLEVKENGQETVETVHGRK